MATTSSCRPATSASARKNSPEQRGSNESTVSYGVRLGCLRSAAVLRPGAEPGRADPRGDRVASRRPERQGVRRRRSIREDLGQGVLRARSGQSAQPDDRRHRPGAERPRREGRVLSRSLHPQAEGSGARQWRGLLRRRQPRAVPPAQHLQRCRRRRRPDHRSPLRRRVAAAAGLHLGRGRLAVRRPRGSDRGPGADRDQQRTADHGLAARVVRLGQGGRLLQLDRWQRDQGLPPGRPGCARLPADGP